MCLRVCARVYVRVYVSLYMYVLVCSCMYLCVGVCDCVMGKSWLGVGGTRVRKGGTACVCVCNRVSVCLYYSLSVGLCDSLFNCLCLCETCCYINRLVGS